MNRIWLNGFHTAAIAAQQSNAPTTGYKVGAALYSGSRLLSIGFNNITKTHPQYAVRNRNGKPEDNFNVSIHAELSAIIKRRYFEDKNLIMYVSRMLASGEYGCSAPCTLCQDAIRLAGIRRVRFFNDKREPEEWKVI